MVEWKKCTLSELGMIVGGATPSTKVPENYENGTIPWITPKDLSQHTGRYIGQGARNISERGLNSCSARMMPKGTILFTSRAPIGYVAISQQPVCTNQGFKSIVPNGDVDGMFIYYLLKYKKNEIEGLGSGTTFKEVSGNTMKNFEVTVPIKREVQSKIASILGILDDKIELNNQINDNLLEQAMTIFENTLQYASQVSYSTLGEIANVKGGKRLPKGVNLITTQNSHPYIRVRDLNNVLFASLTSGYEYVDDETQKAISRYVVTKDDVLISIVGTIGLTAIVDETLNSANLTENCVKVTDMQRITPEYLILYLRSPEGQEEMSKGTVGAVQLKLPIKNIQAIQVPILPMGEMDMLMSVLTPMFRTISNAVLENNRLIQVRDTLLPQLISGKLDVSNIDI